MQSNPEGAFLCLCCHTYIMCTHSCMFVLSTCLWDFYLTSHICLKHPYFLCEYYCWWCLLCWALSSSSTFWFITVMWLGVMPGNSLNAWIKNYDLVLLNASTTRKEEELFDQFMNCSLLPYEQDHCPFCLFWLFKLLSVLNLTTGFGDDWCGSTDSNSGRAWWLCH